MIQLHEYLTLDNIVKLTSTKRIDAVRELVESALKDECCELDKRSFKKLLKDKTLSHGIFISEEILLCHTRTELVSDIRLRVAFCSDIPKFNREPINLMVVILLPEEMSTNYLSLVARLSRFLNGQNGKDALASKDDAKLVEAVEAFDKDLI